jgi:hypothetical protein
LSYYSFGSQATSLGERGTPGDVNCEPYSIIVGAGVICAEQPQHIHHIFPLISELSVKKYFGSTLFSEKLTIKREM